MTVEPGAAEQVVTRLLAQSQDGGVRWQADGAGTSFTAVRRHASAVLERRGAGAPVRLVFQAEQPAQPVLIEQSSPAGQRRLDTLLAKLWTVVSSAATPPAPTAAELFLRDGEVSPAQGRRLDGADEPG